MFFYINTVVLSLSFHYIRQFLMHTYPSAQYTAKFLLGVAPCGVLVFASRCYPGSTSDKEIVQHCGILEKLSVGDNLMADKGFLIHDLLPEGDYQ